MVRKTVRKRVFMVGDGGDATALASCLGKAFDVDGRLRDLPFSLGPVRRHLGYFGLAWQAIRNRRNADCIVFWQQFVAAYFLIMALFIPRCRTPILIYYIIYKPAANRLVDWIKYRAMRTLVNAFQVKTVYFMSREDRLYSCTCDDTRRVIAEHPFHSQIIEDGFAQTPCEGYFFAGGASNRDYAVIRELARLMPDQTFRISCMASQAADLAPLPGNVHVHADVSRTDFENLIMRSMALIIPLEDAGVVSGQLVCMAAMQSAKGIFMTRNRFMSEWIDTGAASRFLRFFDSVDDLLQQLHAVDQAALATMGDDARAFYQSSHDDLVVYHQFAEDIRCALPEGSP